VASGEIDWRICPLLAEECEVHHPAYALALYDGELQKLIDEAAELEEYREWIADQEFWRTGC
jgi:hypothetical protein